MSLNSRLESNQEEEDLQSFHLKSEREKIAFLYPLSLHWRSRPEITIRGLVNLPASRDGCVKRAIWYRNGNYAEQALYQEKLKSVNRRECRQSSVYAR